MAARDAHLRNWTGQDVHNECWRAYDAYREAKTESYRAYFAAHPGLRDPEHGYKARDLTAALPGGWGGLAELLPECERHRHYLSGNSSQVLALGLLGVAARLDPSLRWLWEGLSPLPPPKSPGPAYRFEATLSPETLDESPRQTSIDFLANDPSALICVEAKWTEAGIGSCSCGSAGGNPAEGRCAQRVLDRKAYWDAAHELFELPKRAEGSPCPLSFTYQAVRNVAAAQRLAADGQSPVFALVFDAKNPYFAGAGEWPGWPTALQATLVDAEPSVLFRAISWQELTPILPLDDEAAEWAEKKHGLAAGT